MAGLQYLVQKRRWGVFRGQSDNPGNPFMEDVRRLCLVVSTCPFPFLTAFSRSCLHCTPLRQRPYSDKVYRVRYDARFCTRCRAVWGGVPEDNQHWLPNCTVLHICWCLLVWAIGKWRATWKLLIRHYSSQMRAGLIYEELWVLQDGAHFCSLYLTVIDLELGLSIHGEDKSNRRIQTAVSAIMASAREASARLGSIMRTLVEKVQTYEQVSEVRVLDETLCHCLC